IAEASPGSWPPKSFDGTPSTTSPRGLKRSCSALRSAYCGVKPHSDAVFTSKTGRPAKPASSIMPPARPENEKAWAPSAIALLLPGITLVVIAALLPESGLVARHELDAPDPFGALPEVEFRHDRAHRAAMLARDRLALPFVGKQHVVIVEMLERKVGRVAVVAVAHQMLRALERLDDRQDVAGADPLPPVVVARPGGHAMDIRGAVELRLGQEVLEGPDQRLGDQAVDRELPVPALDLGLDPEIEHRPGLDQML